MKRFARIYRIGLVVLMFVVVGAVFVVGSGMTSAVSSDVNFTLDNSETVLELTVPSSVNMYLSPTDGRDTGTTYVNIGVGTNNSTGYNLSMTASSEELLRTSYVTTNEALTYRPTILPMTTTGSVNGYTESQFESSDSDNDTLNRWGYALSSDGYYKPVTSGSIPISATVAPSNAVDPVYSPGPYNATVYFIAKVDATQPAGTYATTLNFTAVTNHVPITFDTAFAAAGKSKTDFNDSSYYTMQDMTKGICYNVDAGSTTTLLDTRNGGTTYTIAKIGDYCVMTKNLSITGTIPAEGSNFSGSDVTAAYASYSYLSSSYITSKVAVPNDTYGAYYNYCMATAGEVCVGSNATWSNATQDICPAEWQLPSTAMINKVKSSTGAALFQAQLGGYLRSNSSSPIGTTYGYYWSSDRYNNSYPYSLRANATTMVLLGNSTFNYRYYGRSIRCVNAPNDVGVTVKAGDGVSSVSINGGTAGATATGSFRQGDNITISFTANSNYSNPYSWDVTGDSATTNSSTSAVSKTFTVGGSDSTIVISATPYRQVTVTAGTGVSSVSIDGGTAGATASGYYPEGKEITITATPSSNSPAVYNWLLNGTGELTYGYSPSAGSTFQKRFRVGDDDGNITVSLSENVTTVMQNFDSSLCSITGTYVYDNRDDEVYLVKKLADGKCWMLDNLRLDLTDSDVQANLTSSTTNASNTALNYLKNGGGSAPYATAAVTSTYGNYFTVPYGDINYKSGDYKDFSEYGYGSGINGVFYNYCAASAGSYCYEAGPGFDSGYDIQDDICPVGWKMPTSSETSRLHSLYPSTRDFSVAYSALMEDFMWNSSIVDGMEAGADFVYQDGTTHSLSFNKNSYERSRQSTVRCVKDYRPEATVTVTAGSGVSSVSIDGGTAGATATGTFREGSRIEITVTPTSNSAHIYDWTSTGGGTLESGLSVSSGEAFTKTYIVGNTNGVITIDVSNETVQQMQNLSSSLCGTTGTYVYDNRDSEIYLVKKLADNNCWMLDNLRLDLVDSDVQTNLTSSTTNASDTALNYLKNGGGSGGYATAAVENGTSSSYSLNEPIIINDSKDVVLASGYDYNDGNYGDGFGKVGVYYNYCAMSAGTDCYNDSDFIDDDVTEDVCPVGWRLPTKSEYEYFDDQPSNVNIESGNSKLGTLSVTFSGSNGGVGDKTSGMLWAKGRFVEDYGDGYFDVFFPVFELSKMYLGNEDIEWYITAYTQGMSDSERAMMLSMRCVMNLQP